MVFSATTAKILSQSILSFCREKMSAALQFKAPDRMVQYGGNLYNGVWFALIKNTDDKTHSKAASPFKKIYLPARQFAKTPKIITKQSSI
jgi:hypothetical protein